MDDLNTTQRSSADIRAHLDHPVVDGDGHFIEITPVLHDFIKDVAGPSMVKRYRSVIESQRMKWHLLSREERQHKRVTKPPFWALPAANTLDRATAMLPALMRARLEEFGIDYAILYPTKGLMLDQIADAELRCAVMRATNVMNAEVFGSHADRMTPAAMIPMGTPHEAIEELDFAIGELGMKTTMIVGTVRRPIADVAERATNLEAYELPYWVDPLALDSPYDYDPVWEKCVELRVAAADHAFGLGWVNRNSISNYNYNHIGACATSAEAFCKALFMGGVTRRFPTLKFAFLECGAGWACNLYNDLFEHWEKRNIKDLRENLDPNKVNRSELADLLERYGDQRVQEHIDQLQAEGGDYLDRSVDDPAELDEWAACEISSPEDIGQLFVPNFYFGCEADDRMTPGAFNTKLNHLGARLKALFSSDIGHWDVPHANKVLSEAFELVEDDLLTADDFRDFTFTNSVELWGSMNPDFFKGTVIEHEVSKVLETS